MAKGKINKELNDANKAAKDLNDSFNDYRETLRSIASEIGKSTSNLKDARNEYTKLDSLARKLKIEQTLYNLINLEQKQVPS